MVTADFDRDLHLIPFPEITEDLIRGVITDFEVAQTVRNCQARIGELLAGTNGLYGSSSGRYITPRFFPATLSLELLGGVSRDGHWDDVSLLEKTAESLKRNVLTALVFQSIAREDASAVEIRNFLESLTPASYRDRLCAMMVRSAHEAMFSSSQRVTGASLEQLRAIRPSKAAAEGVTIYSLIAGEHPQYIYKLKSSAKSANLFLRVFCLDQHPFPEDFRYPTTDGRQGSFCARAVGYGNSDALAHLIRVVVANAGPLAREAVLTSSLCKSQVGRLVRDECIRLDPSFAPDRKKREIEAPVAPAPSEGPLDFVL